MLVLGLVFAGATAVQAQTTTTVSCSPATQNAQVGQAVSVSATGGTGSYTWSSPDLTISNPSGTGFSAIFNSPGVKTISVASGGQIAVCAVTVAGTTTTPTTPVPTPTLPNTGGGFGR